MIATSEAAIFSRIIDADRPASSAFGSADDPEMGVLR